MTHFWNDHWADRLRRELALRNYSDATARAYLQALGAFLDFAPGDPRKRTRAYVWAYLEHMLRRPGLSASTRNPHRYALVFFFRNVLRQPAAVLELPVAKGDQESPDIFSVDQISRYAPMIALIVALSTY